MDLRAQLVAAGAWMDRAGLVPATSGNLSARRPDGRLWLTRSGPHKGRLTVDDLLLLERDGTIVDGPPGVRSSAETALHLLVYDRDPTAAAVLHGHGLAAVVLSRLSGDRLTLTGWELQKAFAGRTTHEDALDVVIVDNDQDVPALAGRVAAALDATPPARRVPGFLIRGHGLYAWGASVDAAIRHVEALEVLMRAELALRGVSP